jgi:hypothetical protein
MKKRASVFSCLLLAFLSLSIGLPRTAFAQEREPGASLRSPLATSERSRREATARPAQDEKSIKGERKSVVRAATVNFAELARKDALAPFSSQELRAVPEPEEEEEARDRPVPPDAQIFRQSTTPSPLVSQALGPSPVASPSFQGVQATGWIPPDTQGAAGLNHLLVAVNGGVLVQTKTGSNVASVRSLVSFFSPVMNGSGDVFDPRVQYDPYSSRWMLIAVADRSSAASAILVAVSQTSDPTGIWNLYRLDADFSNQSWADYPVVGFNKNWIVISTNMFQNPGFTTPFYSRFYVLNKATFYAGQTGFYTQLDAPSSVSGTIAPTSTYDANLSTMYLLQNWNGNFNGNGFLRLYTITGAVGSESLNNTSQGIFISTPNTWESFPPGVDFAPQFGTSNRIQVNDAGMQSVVYRNGSLWCTHSIFLPAGTTPTRSSVQWWQINPTSFAVQQLGRIDSANGTYFYGYPSISVNRNNDVLIGYSRFSASHYASAGYAYRAGTDPVNSLRDDTVLKAGLSTYFSPTGGRNRWGDYSGTTVDPANDIDMWTLQEYAASTNTWSTWWGRVGAPLPPPANDNFASAQVISGTSGSVSGSNAGATKETGEPNHAGNPGGASVWYRWQAPAGGSITINTSGSSYDTVLAVYTGSSVSALTPIASNDDNPAGGLHSIVTFNAVAGTVYQIAVDGFNGETGSITLGWNLTATVNPLRIDNVLPKAGRATGGQQVKLFGEFAGLSSVTIGGTTASWSYTNGTSEITLVTPSHAVGAVNIVLTPTTGSTLTRNNAFAYLPTTFTDDTLIAGVTTAKAQHIIELRQAVDALRAVAGLSAAAWTDPTLSPNATLLRAVHITELRSNLEAAAAQLGYAAISYTDPTLTAGLPVKRVHIEELRQRIRTIAG